MSYKRIIALRDPLFPDDNIVTFNPEVGTGYNYVYICEDYDLDPVTGKSDKYDLRVGSKVRNYNINDRKLTITGAAFVNPHYTGSVASTTQGLQRQISRVFPVGIERLLYVYNTVDSALGSPDVWYTTAYVDSLDIISSTMKCVRFKVTFLLPDVYFRKDPVTVTAQVQDKSGETNPHWFSQVSISNNSDTPCDVIINYNSLDPSRYQWIYTTSWVYKGEQFFQKSSIRFIKDMTGMSGMTAMRYDSNTGEFYAYNNSAIGPSMWKYTADNVKTENTKLYPGNSYFTIRMYYPDVSLIPDEPVITFSYIPIKSDPISRFSDR